MKCCFRVGKGANPATHGVLPRSKATPKQMIPDVCGCLSVESCTDVVLSATTPPTPPNSYNSVRFSGNYDNRCSMVPTAGAAVGCNHIGIVNYDHPCCETYSWTYGVIYRNDGAVFVDAAFITNIAGMVIGNTYSVTWRAATNGYEIAQNSVVIYSGILPTTVGLKCWGLSRFDGEMLFSINPIR